jgi:hypothetical protein
VAETTIVERAMREKIVLRCRRHVRLEIGPPSEFAIE